jgi:FkbM family methyltransferase
MLRFKNVELNEKGCSNEKGEISFSVPVQQSGAVAPGLAFIGSRNDEHSGKEQFDVGNFHTTYAQQVRWTETREVTCEVVALDEFLPSVENLSLIKIDVEGAELFAFRGAEKLISKHLPSVICEINPWYLKGFGVQLDELTDFFFDKGYKIYTYQNEGENKFMREVKVEEVVEDNYTFIHPTRLKRFSALLEK